MKYFVNGECIGCGMCNGLCTKVFFMNNEMLYKLFSNSLSKMNDNELAKSLEKAKLMLSEDDFSKLVEFINIEKRRQNN